MPQWSSAAPVESRTWPREEAVGAGFLRCDQCASEKHRKSWRQCTLGSTWRNRKVINVEDAQGKQFFESLFFGSHVHFSFICAMNTDSCSLTVSFGKFLSGNGMSNGQKGAKQKTVTEEHSDTRVIRIFLFRYPHNPWNVCCLHKVFWLAEFQTTAFCKESARKSRFELRGIHCCKWVGNAKKLSILIGKMFRSWAEWCPVIDLFLNCIFSHIPPVKVCLKWMVSQPLSILHDEWLKAGQCGFAIISVHIDWLLLGICVFKCGWLKMCVESCSYWWKQMFNSLLDIHPYCSTIDHGSVFSCAALHQDKLQLLFSQNGLSSPSDQHLNSSCSSSFGLLRFLVCSARIGSVSFWMSAYFHLWMLNVTSLNADKHWGSFSGVSGPFVCHPFFASSAVSYILQDLKQIWILNGLLSEISSSNHPLHMRHHCCWVKILQREHKAYALPSGTLGSNKKKEKPNVNSETLSHCQSTMPGCLRASQKALISSSGCLHNNANPIQFYWLCAAKEMRNLCIKISGTVKSFLTPDLFCSRHVLSCTARPIFRVFHCQTHHWNWYESDLGRPRAI